jgi:hypothetical protein
MVLPGKRKHYAGECSNCGQEFESDSRPQRDEDGRPDYDFRTTPCAGCGKPLCEHCKENGQAFTCADDRLRCGSCAAECDVCKEHHPHAELKDMTECGTGRKVKICTVCIETEEDRNRWLR